MNDEAVLLESRTLRTGLAERTDVLAKVKALAVLPDGVHVTTEGVAAYFEVPVQAVRSLVFDHQDELASNGHAVISGSRLNSFKELSGIQSRARSLALFPRRAVLNVAMLLRDSEVARAVRRHLLDATGQQPDLTAVTLGQLAEQATRAVQQRVAELQLGIAALEARHAALSARVRRDQELLAALSARLADTSGVVRTLGGRVDLLCTLATSPGRGSRHRRL